MTHTNLTPVERDALLVRNEAALRVLRTDPTLTPEEALLMVVAPSTAIRAASLRAVEIKRDAERAARAEVGECATCNAEVDEDGFCPMCGGVSLDAALRPSIRVKAHA